MQIQQRSTDPTEVHRNSQWKGGDPLESDLCWDHWGRHIAATVLISLHLCFLRRRPAEYEPQCWSWARAEEEEKTPTDVSFTQVNSVTDTKKKKEKEREKEEQAGIKSLIRALERWLSWPCSHYPKPNNYGWSTDNKLTARECVGGITSTADSSVENSVFVSAPKHDWLITWFS